MRANTRYINSSRGKSSAKKGDVYPPNSLVIQPKPGLHQRERWGRDEKRDGGRERRGRGRAEVEREGGKRERERERDGFLMYLFMSDILPGCLFAVLVI